MGYLVDTNIISELIKIKPNQQVVKWFNSVNSQNLYLSVLTLGEIRKGISKINDSVKKEKIRLWLEQELLSWFEGSILPIDHQIALKWGMLQSHVERTLPAIDSLIAATALHFDLILVTRNVRDFKHPGLELINPFDF